jgi:hypothetical protein
MRLSKKNSGVASGTYGASRHQRAIGAQPLELVGPAIQGMIAAARLRERHFCVICSFWWSTIGAIKSGDVLLTHRTICTDAALAPRVIDC